MFCLDSNIAIQLLRGGRPDVENRLADALVEGTVGLSAIVLMELQYGVHRATHRERAQAALDRLLTAPFVSLPFTDDDAACAGRTKADLASQGLSIGPYDALIAAQAITRQMILMTSNTRGFSRIAGLKLVDWLTP
jgi:tRNA(fMet)-specific endonuclease VapC